MQIVEGSIEFSHGRSLKDNNTKVFRKLFKGLRGAGAALPAGGWGKAPTDRRKYEEGKD